MSTKTLRDAAMAIEDSAGMMEEFANWNGALFAAIAALTEQRDVSPGEPQGLGAAPRVTVARLAEIGEFLAGRAQDEAEQYRGTAEELQKAQPPKASAA